MCVFCLGVLHNEIELVLMLMFSWQGILTACILHGSTSDTFSQNGGTTRVKVYMLGKCDRAGVLGSYAN
jgi:hypothetical protein